MTKIAIKNLRGSAFTFVLGGLVIYHLFADLVLYMSDKNYENRLTYL